MFTSQIYAETFKRLATTQRKPMVRQKSFLEFILSCRTAGFRVTANNNHMFNAPMIGLILAFSQVLYPVIKEPVHEELPRDPGTYTSYCNGYDTIFLSLNRLVMCRIVLIEVEFQLIFCPSACSNFFYLQI